MTDLLAWLEATAFATWVRESGSLWAYPLILTLHTIGLSLLVGANAALDLRLLGFARRIPLLPLVRLFRVMWLGFVINALSGIMLFVADATVKGTQTIFFVKLGFVVLGVINMVALRRIVAADAAAGFISPGAKVLAGTSLVIWTGAITTGRFMAYLGVDVQV
jgi:hypothetical protein